MHFLESLPNSNDMKTTLKRIADALYWEKSEQSFRFTTLHRREEKPFAHLIPAFDNPKINEHYRHDNQQWKHREVVVRIDSPVLIEPDYGIVLHNKRTIFPESHAFKNLYPSVPRLWKHAFSKTNAVLPEAILFDGCLGTNYFHFFSDVLPKIWLLERWVNLSEIPLIVPERTYRRAYFQHMLAHTPMGNFKWYVQQPGEYIEVSTLYFAKPMPYDAAYWSAMQRALLPPSVPKENRAIFIMRSAKSGRYLENLYQLKPILKEYKVEVVDTDGMSLQEQIELMQSASHLIGIHGAGMTNMAFRGSAHLKILELNPANRISCHYYWLANTLGYTYDVLLGSELPYTNVYPEQGFSIDVNLFAIKIKRFFEE